MASTSGNTRTRQIFLYFGPLTLLIYLLAPERLLDIPTSYMLKNQLHATAAQVSSFRVLTGIPIYLGFVFGVTRDLWSPMNLRDRGFLMLFPSLTAMILMVMALGHVTYTSLLIGMTAVMISFQFIIAAYQGLIALIGQEALMSGRLSALWNIFSYLPLSAAAFAAGFITEHMTPGETFLIVAAPTLLISLFGLWKPRAVFLHTYDSTLARGSDLLGDIKRLLRHRAIFPALLINFLWYFTPGVQTALQYHLAEHLHAADSIYADYYGIYIVSFLPTFLLYGFLCTRVPHRTLLWWSTLIAVPAIIPLAFIHSGDQALLLAIPMGLMGGLASAAYYDLAMRSCPAGLQGTFMMLTVGIYVLSLRGSDLLGSWIYANSSVHGFLYCVIATTATTALILSVIPLIPKQLTATADGESDGLLEAAILSEAGACSDLY
jgi:hypothetical protein